MEAKHEVYMHNHNLKYSPANASTCGRALKVISEETWLQRWWTPGESSLLSICCNWSLWCKHRDAALWRSRRPSWLFQTGRACFRLRTPEGLLSLPAGEEKTSSAEGNWQTDLWNQSRDQTCANTSQASWLQSGRAAQNILSVIMLS